MKTQGRIYVDNTFASSKHYIIDAEPHVMSRIRILFDTGRPHHYGMGKYTHRPVAIPKTMASARDLVWVMNRYPLEVEMGLLEEIERQAASYDAIIAAVADADKDPSFRISPEALPLALPLREHQAKFRNMALKVKRMLNADKMGLGKTVQAISLLCEPTARPALVVVPATICTQWVEEINRFLPGAKVHVIRGIKPYALPPADVYVTAYNRLTYWQDTLYPLAKDKQLPTVIFDEVHELRHIDTSKRETARAISLHAEVCVGLTGTPIFNYGSEIWSVVDAIAPEALGRHDDFYMEWCLEKKVREPVVLNSYLKTRGLFLRREPEDVGLSFGSVSKHVYTLDADLDKLKEVQNVAKMLAISVLSGSISQDGSWAESAREFDWKLRHATGVAKARPVAEFVKMLCEQGDKVMLSGWHRDVYDIWLKELESLKPVMITGSESPAQKDEAKKRFIEDDECRVIIISNRSGAGIDGLQRVCNTYVNGELDWSPHVLDQLVSRLHRDGQTKHVQAFYLTINDGADPFMTQVLNLKRSQHDGVVEGIEDEARILDAPYSADRIREMAAAYLESIGEEKPIVVSEDGLLGQVASALRRVRVPVNTEEEMQSALWGTLPKLLPDDAALEREVKVGKRSRLDFMVSRGGDKIGIECKIEATGRAEVYRQVRRYAQEAGVTALALFAPWGGVPSFVVDGVPVVVVDYSVAAL